MLSWINNERPVLWGVLFFICGALGGLITAAFSLGDSIPGIGGANLVEADEAKAAALGDRMSRRQSELESVQSRIARGEDNEAALQFVATQHMQQIDSLQSQIQVLQTRISANRWASWKFGMPIYVLVGGGTSLLLAKDILQAIVFGATWTSVVSAIGLKSNAQQKQDLARQFSSDLASKLEQVSKENSDLKGQHAVLQNNMNQTAQIAEAALKRLQGASSNPPPSSNG
jgi:septal ring factor EnvC (AmiA/AmiB activator)